MTGSANIPQISPYRAKQSGNPFYLTHASYAYMYTIHCHSPTTDTMKVIG